MKRTTMVKAIYDYLQFWKGRTETYSAADNLLKYIEREGMEPPSRLLPDGTYLSNTWEEEYETK